MTSRQRRTLARITLAAALATALVTTACSNDPDGSGGGGGGGTNNTTIQTNNTSAGCTVMFGDACITPAEQIIGGLYPEGDDVPTARESKYNHLSRALSERLLFLGGPDQTLHAIDAAGEVTRLGSTPDLEEIVSVGDRAVIIGANAVLSGTDGMTLERLGYTLPITSPTKRDVSPVSVASFADGLLLNVRAEQQEGAVTTFHDLIVRTDGSAANTSDAPFAQLKSIKSAWPLDGGRWALTGASAEDDFVYLWVLDSAQGVPRRISEARVDLILAQYGPTVLLRGTFGSEHFMVNTDTEAIVWSSERVYLSPTPARGERGFYLNPSTRKIMEVDADGAREISESLGADAKTIIGVIKGRPIVRIKGGFRTNQTIATIDDAGARVDLTTKLQDVPNQVYALGDRLILTVKEDKDTSVPDATWVTDGTPEGTAQICTLICDGFRQVGEQIWMLERERRLRIGGSYQLLALDAGTTTPTKLLVDHPWFGLKLTSLQVVETDAPGRDDVFLRANTMNHGQELFWTDGARIIPLGDVGEGIDDGVTDTVKPVWFGDAWYFVGQPNTGAGVWRWRKP